MSNISISIRENKPVASICHHPMWRTINPKTMKVSREAGETQELHWLSCSGSLPLSGQPEVDTMKLSGHSRKPSQPVRKATELEGS